MFPLIPPGLASLTERIDRGEARAIMRGRSTVEQVLARGLAAMEAEDLAEDPVAYLNAHRRRNTLLARILHGKGR